MKRFLYLLLPALLVSCSEAPKTDSSSTTSETQPNPTSEAEVQRPEKGTLEVVADLMMCPGNVAVSRESRVFMTIHPLRPENWQLVEVLKGNYLVPWPNEEIQSLKEQKTADKLDTPLGIFIDKKERLWIIDAGLNLQQTRLFCFDISTGEQLHRFDFPEDIAPKTSFAQDLAVDETNDWVYIADFGDPGIIAVDVAKGTFRKFSDAATMAAEDIDMIIDGKVTNFNGAPARVGINPITLSEDRETVFYGPMSGKKWYGIPAKLFREGAGDEDLLNAISVAGPKPISDGVATAPDGRHYFTNLQEGRIDVLDDEGNLSPITDDPRIIWPDNCRMGEDGWLYIAVNQLHRAPAFTGGDDEAELPFYIMRVWPD